MQAATSRLACEENVIPPAYSETEKGGGFGEKDKEGIRGFWRSLKKKPPILEKKK